MEKVTGIGGIFFKSDDPGALQRWYAEHLGLAAEADGTALFRWREEGGGERPGLTVWAPFPRHSDYFDPTRAPFMINYRVRDLEAMLVQLRVAGVAVDEKVELTDYGKFGWAVDAEGNRFELWEPPAE